MPCLIRIKSVFYISLAAISLLGLFSFSASSINYKLEQQFSKQLSIDLYQRPRHYPIHIKFIEKITAEFGVRIHPITNDEKMHTGVDLIAAEGTDILAADNGKILKVAFSDAYGNYIIIQHNFKFKTLYAHLKSISVKEGQVVDISQKLGVIGSTGKSIFTHLHYEMYEFGVQVDPKIVIGC